MSRFILSICIVFLPISLSGQMFPLSNHYINNTLAINPAFAGHDNALSATITYRNQWVGFKDAPKSYMLSLHAPVNNNRIGLGLLVGNNSIGIYNETSFIGNYAYRRELFSGRIALGLGFGVTLYNSNWNELEKVDEDDVLLTNNPSSAVLPDFSLGTYYYTEKYFFGISMPLFLSHELDQETGRYRIKNDFSSYNYFITGGYQVGISPDVKLTPSILIKYHPNNVVQIDFSAQIGVYDRVWMGFGYRSKDVIVGMLQCKLNKQLSMAYSYDFDIGPAGKYTNGSHEILINYVFNYVRKVAGPRQY